MSNTILSGKYQLCQIIGRGRTGTVYLAWHKELEEYRAVKVVDKDSIQYDTFRKEALLLKELHHPCIPIVYDIEEDELHGYLVEEYLQGDSFESLVKRQGPLARCTVLKYAIQLCGVVKYLHSAGTEPILHLDLQPKNLLVCHEKVKLVDFGQASGCLQANQARQRFGTVGFAAPEQYDCNLELDERTDIYAIGGLILYLATGKEPGGISPAVLGNMLWSREAGRIIAACLEPRKEERYPSVSQLMEDLNHLWEKPVSSLVVTVHGLEPCIGTTHISLALCSYLWSRGIPNLYEECHNSRHIRCLMEALKREVDSFGIFPAFGCMLKPYHGRQIGFQESDYPIRIQDWGIVHEAFPSAALKEGEKDPLDISLLVVGGKWWNRPLPQDIAGKRSRIILYNFSDRRIGIRSVVNGKESISLRVPLFGNPFHPDKEVQEWLGFLWDRIERSQAEGGKAGKARREGMWDYVKRKWSYRTW